MKLYIQEYAQEYAYSIKEIHFCIDELGPIDIEIKADDEVLDAIEQNHHILSGMNCYNERCIFIGRMPKFELR